MKKAGFLIVFILVGILLILVSKAQEDTHLPKEIEKISDVGKSVTDDEGNLKIEYLKKEWKNIIFNSSIGKMMTKIEDFLQPVNPVFKITTGLNFSWSFLFILNLAIWIALVTYSYRFLEFVAIVSRAIKIIIALVFVILISVTGITRTLSGAIINSINKIPNLPMQIVAVVFLIVFFIFASIYSSFLKEIAIKMREKREVKKAAETAKEAKEQAKEAKGKQEELENNISEALSPLEGDEE